MQDASIIQIVRTVCGAVLLTIALITQRDGVIVASALVLMSVPFEAVTLRKKEEASDGQTS